MPHEPVAGEPAGPATLDDLLLFRGERCGCLTARADALFELTDAVLCADGPVKTLVGLTLAPEHRRGHGALYDGLNRGRIDIARFRRSLAVLPLPRAADGADHAGRGYQPVAAPGRGDQPGPGCSATCTGGARDKRR
jgi:hypothetical protein